MNSKHVSSRRRGEEARQIPLRDDGPKLAREDASPPKGKTYVTDQLVLTVVEHDAPIRPLRDADQQAQVEHDRVQPTELVPYRLRTTVEALAKRRVTAMLSGTRTDPDVTFDLFLFEE